MLWLVILLFVIPLIGLIVYLALSSCLGDGLRSRRVPRPSFGREYLGSISSGAWENIEMVGIRGDSDADDSEDDDDEHVGDGVFWQH